MTLSHIAEVLPAVLPRKRIAIDDLIRDAEAREAQEDDTAVSLARLRFTPEGTLAVPGHAEPLAFTDWSKQQLATLVGVRWARWFAVMSPEEQAEEVNKRLERTSTTMCLRATTAEGGRRVLRALVSRTFVPLPDSEVLRLMKTALESVERDLFVLRAEVTDRSTIYTVGVGRPFRPNDDHLVGDLHGAVTMRNSGVAYAAFSLFASFERLVCKNGMTAPIDGALLLRRAHRAFDLGKLRDALITRFRELPGKLADAARALVASREHPAGNPKAAFEALLKAARLPLKHLPDLERAYEVEPQLKGSAFGISQAATRAAQGMSPEDRFALENAAGEYLSNLSRTVN